MIDDVPWHVQRLRELEAAAPVKRKEASSPFVKMPIRWAAAAAKAVRSPATMVLVELLHAAWRTKSMSFSLPNARLAKLGVSREVKRRVLRALEGAGLVRVERRTGRPPLVHLLL